MRTDGRTRVIIVVFLNFGKARNKFLSGNFGISVMESFHTGKVKTQLHLLSVALSTVIQKHPCLHAETFSMELPLLPDVLVKLKQFFFLL